MSAVRVAHGEGAMADPDGKVQQWSGRKAIEYTALTLANYGTRCWLCGLPGATTADHIIPRSKGGAVFSLDNLGPAHEHCNYSRGNRAASAYSIVEDGTAWFTAA